jgi:hypothetical protein
MSANNFNRYKPQQLVKNLGFLVEECGEVQAAVGKTLRHGLDALNPEVPVDQCESHRDWILRGLDDLDLAINIVRRALRKAPARKGVTP